MNQPHLDQQYLDDVLGAIKVIQDRGQVVTYESLEITMKKIYGAADIEMIKAAVDELERQERIASRPLFPRE